MLKSKVILSVVSMCLLLSLFFPMNAYATTPIEQTAITKTQAPKPSLFWSYVSNCNVDASSSGKTIKTSAYIEARTGTKILGTLYLEKYSGGRWVSVKSWSVTGTSSVSSNKSYTGSYGTTYRARFSGTATYSGKSESVSATSVSIAL